MNCEKEEKLPKEIVQEVIETEGKIDESCKEENNLEGSINETNQETSAIETKEECQNKIIVTDTTITNDLKEETKEQESKEIVIRFEKPNLNSAKFKKIAIGFIVAVVLLFGGIALSANAGKNSYQKNINTIIDKMFDGGLMAEEASNLIKKVWYNTIYEEADPETNYYTLQSYYRDRYKDRTYVDEDYFNEDFNDSIKNLYADPSFQTKIRAIESYQSEVDDLMKKLIDVPKGMEAAYNAVDELYEQFQGLTRCATNPSGSLSSYSKDFSSYDTGFVDAWKKAKLYQE